jgi:hypothetical protein
MKTMVAGNILQQTCVGCGNEATHFIKKTNILGWKVRYYCKKCWIKEMQRLGYDRI